MDSEHTTLVRIKVTHKSTGLPAVGYFIDVTYMPDGDNKVTDTDGNIEPFYIDMNNYIYANIFVRDPEENIIMEAEGQYPLVIPETAIHIEL
jgi:hypothetical protein